MDSGSLAELRQHFQEWLLRTSRVVHLRDAMASTDSLCLAHCRNLRSELDSLEALLKLMREELAKQQEQTANYTQGLKGAAKTLVDRLHYTEENLPKHLPHSQKQETNQNSNSAKSGSNSQAATGRESSCSTTSKSSSKDPSQASSAHPLSAPVCPTIDYLTTEEFDTVPKYMKGRMQYQQINKIIDDINKTFQTKYNIMNMKKSKMNDITRKRFGNYKMQETKDTKGVYFVVEADMKEFSSIRMDRTMHGALTVLRHCGRMREIRGGRLTRYAIIEAY